MIAEPQKFDLSGCSILIVEDEFFVAIELEDAFLGAGASIVGPVATVAEAHALLDGAPRLDAAVLDINLQGEMIFPVADRLLARDIPFIFATGYDSVSIPAAYGAVTRCEKPVNAEDVGRALMPAVMRRRQ